MNRTQITLRVRSLTRDFSNAIFRETDIIDYINEGINRFKQIIPELGTLSTLNSKDDIPVMIPEQYHHLLAVYSASRCFAQDERHYQASTYMNEFETKLDELKVAVEEGRITIIDPVTGEAIESTYEPDSVTDVYFHKKTVTEFPEG